MTVARWSFFVTTEGRILEASLVLDLKSAYKSPVYLEMPPSVSTSLPPIFFIARVCWRLSVGPYAGFAI